MKLSKLVEHIEYELVPVSYTHLDVYKRQHPISNLFEWILAKGLFLKDKVFEPMQRFCSLSKVSVA